MILSRNEKGDLELNSLDLEIFLGELFMECNTQKEIDWLSEQLQDFIVCISEDREEELEYI